MKSAICLAVLLFSVQFCFAAVINVPDDQPTIQAGIDAAVDGDTVLVADGTYTGNGNRDVDFGARNIVVKSENGPEFTIVDCEGSQSDPHRGFYFHSGEDSSAILEGFTIQGGYGPYDSGGESVGGGVKCDSSSSPTLIDCVFYQNHYELNGGGMYCEDASPTLIDCVFSGNRSERHDLGYGNGSGMYCDNSSPTLIGCTFTGNLSAAFGDGGGICCKSSSPTLESCAFIGNHAGGIGGKGGGMFGFLSFPTFTDCSFAGNYAEYGGGIIAWGDTALITGCVFSKNKATYDTQPGGWGGGLLSWASSITLINCTFSGNDANPVQDWYGYGSAIAASGSSILLENSIIAFCPESDAIYCYDSPPSLICCDVFGNVAGDWTGCIAEQAGINGNFSLDPEFCDTAGNDYRLSVDSPCLPENNDCDVIVGALGIGCGYVCGDADASGKVDIDDAVCVIGFIFGGIPELEPYESGDVDCSGLVDIDDAVYLVSFIFSGGNPPCDPDGDGSSDC